MPERPNPYRGHRFPRAVIAHAVRLYLRFALSLRDVEELLAERGIAVSYETVRRWVAKFGTYYAEELRRRERRPSRTWHLDEMGVRVGGQLHWLWRAVDEHGQTVDVLLQGRRDTEAAAHFFRRLLGSTGGPPERITRRICAVTTRSPARASRRVRAPWLRYAVARPIPRVRQIGATLWPVTAWTRRTNSAFFYLVAGGLEDLDLHHRAPERPLELADALLGGAQFTQRHDRLVRRDRRLGALADQVLPPPEQRVGGLQLPTQLGDRGLAPGEPPDLLALELT